MRYGRCTWPYCDLITFILQEEFSIWPKRKTTKNKGGINKLDSECCEKRNGRRGQLEKGPEKERKDTTRGRGRRKKRMQRRENGEEREGREDPLPRWIKEQQHFDFPVKLWSSPKSQNRLNPTERKKRREKEESCLSLLPPCSESVSSLSEWLKALGFLTYLRPAGRRSVCIWVCESLCGNLWSLIIYFWFIPDPFHNQMSKRMLCTMTRHPLKIWI